MVSKLILIQGLPWSWKTTIANKIESTVKEKWYSAIVISVDLIYLEFIKEKRPYMYWIEIEKNIQRHYEKLEKEHQILFIKHLQTKIVQQQSKYIIVEWRHLTTMMNEIKHEFLNTFLISEIIMRKENNCLMQKWNVYTRDIIWDKIDFIL